MRVKESPRSGRRGRLLAVGLVVVAAATTACSGSLKGGSGPRIMVIGDSIMHDLAPNLDGATGNIPFDSATIAGCPIVRGQPLAWNGSPIVQAAACHDTIWRGHEEHMNAFNPNIIVWLGIWEQLPRQLDGVVFTAGACEWEHPSGSLCGAQADNLLINAMNQKVAQLTSRGARLLIVTMPPPVPESPGSPENSHVFQPPVRLDVRTEHLNVLLRYVASIHPGVQLVDFATVACPPNGRPPCPLNIPGQDVPLRPDGAHFHGPGALWASATLAQMILG